MNDMEFYDKEVDVTRFHKTEKVEIDDVLLGDIVYVKVKNPTKCTIHTLEYFGRITKVTKCFFWILEYCEYTWSDNSCRTDQIQKREDSKNRATKQWHKNSLIEIWKVNATRQIETHRYGRSKK